VPEPLSQRAARRKRRSIAWVVYAFLTVASVSALITGHVVGLAGLVLFGPYARYLYRGGRFVIWFW
jgi:hypothetical protein